MNDEVTRCFGSHCKISNCPFIGEHYWIEHCHVWQAKTDFALTCMQVAKLHCPIQYPKPDEVLSFDVPTSLHRFVYTFEFLICVRLY